MPTTLPTPPNTKPLKAAALQYDKETSAAPKLTAKGQGAIAERILEVAEAHGIPLHKDADLIEILDKVEIDTEIPLEVYAVVAEIFAYLYRTGQSAAQHKQKANHEL